MQRFFCFSVLFCSSTIKRGSRVTNQTEIVYTVFVNGVPVLALIAADDMKMISEAEMTSILGHEIHTKAERKFLFSIFHWIICSQIDFHSFAAFLKEPQATPLIPSNHRNDKSTILATIFANPYLLILIGVVAFLFVCLLMAAMLAASSASPQKRLRMISREAQTTQIEHIDRPTAVDVGSSQQTHLHAQAIDSLPTTIENQPLSLHGYDNYGYEREQNSFVLLPSPPKRKHNKKVGTPTIYFPRPPPTHSPTGASQTPSTASSVSSLSDTSSIYYIKKQRRDWRDERYQPIYMERRPKGDKVYGGREKVYRDYATVSRNRKNRKNEQPKRIWKENAIDDRNVQIHYTSKRNDKSHRRDNNDIATNIVRMAAVSDDTFETSDGKETHFYEHIEAINPTIGYRDDLLMEPNRKSRLDKSSSVSGSKSLKRQKNSMHLNRMINEEEEVDVVAGSRKTRREQFDEEDLSPGIQMSVAHEKNKSASNDNASVGSFLSMASMPSFPKCEAPEPLNRVLETTKNRIEFDETDAIAAATAAARKPRIVDTKLKTDLFHQGESFKRTQSERTDPGVIGPVVWELHKKSRSRDSLPRSEKDKSKTKSQTESPPKDPAMTRHRYEDLIEGAMNMYTIETTELYSIETITKEEIPGAIAVRDSSVPRGKSAFVSWVCQSSSNPITWFSINVWFFMFGFQHDKCVDVIPK